MRLVLLSVVVSTLALPCPALAQFSDAAGTSSDGFGPPQTFKYQAGLKVTAVGGTCRGLYATLPEPFDWPEQQVRVVEEDVSIQVQRVRHRRTDDGVSQVLIDIPELAGGQEARALFSYEVTCRPILPPREPSQFVIPKRLPREIKAYLASSPMIDVRHNSIRSLAKELSAEKASDWAKVESLYDHVREHLKFEQGPPQGSVDALRSGQGDAEDLVSLFIALCRAEDIPARTVWVPGHCYAEFFLENSEGEGRWFPCQVAGKRAFGEMPEPRPILQKGDNFRVPEKPRDRQRYVAEFLRGVPVRGGGGRPKVKFVRELVD